MSVVYQEERKTENYEVEEKKQDTLFNELEVKGSTGAQMKKLRQFATDRKFNLLYGFEAAPASDDIIEWCYVLPNFLTVGMVDGKEKIWGIGSRIVVFL